MTQANSSPPPSPDITREPLPDDAAIEQRLRELLLTSGPPRARTLWVVFIGPDDRQLPVIVPVDDVPSHPDPGLLNGLARACGTLVSADGADAGGSVVFTLERPGSARIRAGDEAWFTGLRHSAAAASLAVRGIYLITSAGLRPLTLDDAT